MDKLEIEIGADLTTFNKDLNAAKDDIKGFNERSKRDRAIELSLNIAKLKEDLNALKKQLKADIPTDTRINIIAKTEVLKQEITQAGRQLRNFLRTGQEDVSVLWKLFSNLGNTIRNQFSGLGWLLASAFAVGSIKSFSDEFRNMQNTLSQVAQGKELEILQNRILKMANETRTPVAELASSFVRYDAVVKSMWGNQEQTFKILDSLTKSLISTGRTASEASSVVLQLSQAFASGKLQGDEFRSLSENMPQIMDILAKSMGVPRAKLKELASDWKITAEVLKNALIQANEQINAQFAKSQMTIGQALVKLRNSILVAFGNFDKETGFTDAIVKAIWKIEELVGWFGTAEWKSVLLGVAVAGVTALLSSLIPVIASLGVAFTATATAWGLLAWVMTALWGPVTLIIGALWLLSGASYYAYQSFNGLTGITGSLQKELNWLQKQQEETNKAFNDGAISQEEYTKRTEDNRIAQQDLQNAINDVKNETLTYWDVKARIDKLKHIADTEAYERETKIINTQIIALKELLKVKAINAKTALAQFQLAKSSETPMTWPGSLVGNESTKEQIEASMKAFKEYEKQQKEYEKMQKEVEILEKWITEAGKAREQAMVWTGGGGGAWTSWKSGSAKSIIDAKKKQLEKIAEEEIKAVNKSALTEVEKAKKILAINEKLKEDIAKLEGKNVDLLVKNAEEIVKNDEESRKKLSEWRNELYKNLAEKEKQNLSDVKVLANEYENLKNKLTEVSKKWEEDLTAINSKLKELKANLEDLQNKAYGEIAQRGIDAQKELNDLQAKGASISADDLEKMIELQRELNFVNANTTEEQRANAVIESQKTKAELIYDEMKAKEEQLKIEIADAEEKKKRTTEQMELDKKAINDKMTAIATQITTETNLIISEQEKRKKLEEWYTAFFWKQIEQRKTMIDDLIAKSKEMQSALQAAWISNLGAWINTGGGTSNTSTTINVTNNKDVDAESFLRVLNSKIPTK